ncbi:MAG: DUF4388 domain-containing protein [Tepidiformaceae bacterium]
MPEGLTGSLTQLPLSDILTMLAAGGQSGRLELADGAERGDIFLRGGAIVHALSSAHSGETALGDLLRWTTGAFRFQPHVLSTDVTIDKPLERLLSEGVRHAMERDAVLRVVPSADAIPHISVEVPSGPITLQPHEWQVLSQVDGRTTIGEIAANMRCDEFSLMEALVPMVSGGMLKLELATRAAPVRAVASPAFFASLTAAVAAAMGPLAEIIIDDCIDGMGLTRESLPREMVSTLVERIASEIRDVEKRVRFQQTMLAILRNQAA